MTSQALALLAVEKLIALAVVFQTIELFQIRTSFAERGIWRWSILRDEFTIFPTALQSTFKLALPYSSFLCILAARLTCAIVLLFFTHPLLVLYLLLSTLLISVRWRGTFNGGSDYMTILVLGSLTLASCFGYDSIVALGCLGYIAIQACSSYLISGAVKLRNADWRKGVALPRFIESSIYEPSSFLQNLLRRPSLGVFFSWLAILFECTFPVSLFDPRLCLIYISAAIFFHLANVYLFGLNRFLFAWGATYPALYFCSRYINS